MLRTLLVGILAMTAAAACSSRGDAPAAQPGVAAGKVVELTGTVTATRGDQVRTLAAGGEISSDDVIDTAANSRVVILVAHNNARWDLGPNKHGKVAESLAWTAAKQDRPAAAVIEESSTAGAHAEKSAATTGTTTEAAQAVMAAEPRAADKEVAADEDADFQTKGPAPGGAPTPAPDMTPPPPPPPPRPEPSRRKVATPPPTTAPAQMQPRESNSSKEAAAVPMREEEKAVPRTGKAEISVSGGAPADGMGTSDSSVRGDSAPDPARTLDLEIRKQFTKLRATMRACFEPTAPNVLIQITVTEGVYAITTVDPAATPKARACLASIAKDIRHTTKHAKAVSVKLTLAKP